MKIAALLAFFSLLGGMLWWSIFGLPFPVHNEGMLMTMWVIGLILTGVIALNEK